MNNRICFSRISGLAGLVFLIMLSACLDNGSQTTRSGLEYNIERNGGDLAKNGDYIIIHAVFKTSRDSLVFDYRSNGLPLPVMYDSVRHNARQLNDLEEVIFGMGKGDSSSLRMSPELFYQAIFHSKIPEGLMEGDMIVGGIKVDTIVDKRNYASWQQHQLAQRREQVKKLEQQREQKALQAIGEYLDGKGIKTERTKNGVQYHKSHNGWGHLAQINDSVFFSYQGRQLTGELFSTSGKALQSIVIGQPKNIDMWDEVLQCVRKGDKLSIYASYATAFEGGKPPDVEPGVAVMFDVEVVDVK